MSKVSSKESRPAPRAQRTFSRSIYAAIGLSCLVTLFACMTLWRLTTILGWNFALLHDADRLSSLHLSDYLVNGSGVYVEQARLRTDEIAKAPDRCLNQLLPIEVRVSHALGVGPVFEHCEHTQELVDLAYDYIARAEAGDISVHQLEAELTRLAEHVKKEASVVEPFLVDYTNRMGGHIVLVTIVVGAFLFFHAARQSRLIRASFASARRLHERLDNAVGSISNGFAIYDPRGYLVECNDAYRLLTADPPEMIQPGMHQLEILDRTINAGFYAGDPREIRELLRKGMRNSPQNAEGLTVELADGRFVRTTFTRSSSGERVVTRVDQTKARKREVEAARAARTDPLTGLPNRRFFDEVAAARPLGQGASDQRTTVVRIDLDNFKYVNDSLGHAAGDRVLQHVAEALKSAVGAGDFAARLGGDEFLVLFAPGASDDDVEALITRVKDRISKPLTYRRSLCRFGASFGVASSDLAPANMVELLSFADVALYEAKRKGRGRTERFTPRLLKRVKHDRRIADEIRGALERHELVPYLQPQLDAASREIIGFEVLARWQHPELGLLTPDRFLGVAEKLRIVPDIDRAMFDALFGFTDRLRDAGLPLPRLSFNVSAGRLRDPGLAEGARALIAKGVPVVFEVLESIAVEDEDLLAELDIDRLRDEGVAIELDDFGSGQASIVGVMALNPDGLKIDRRIVQPMLEDGQSLALVRAVIEIAHSLGLHTVAEGVETQAHADALARLGADILQGYAFARPMSEDQAMNLLAGAGLAQDRGHRPPRQAGE